MVPNKSKVIVILGPTASGKSDVAIRLAKKFNGAVISADSRQVYRGMDIGTGKIPRDFFAPKSKIRNHKSELQVKNKKFNTYWSKGVAHYFIDSVNPKTDYNVAKFKKDANYVINYLLINGKLPIICGGTGFWIQAIVDNVSFPEVKPDWNLRKKLEKKSSEELFRMLKKLDPERAIAIDKFNKVRIIRATEICQALGKVPKIMEHGTHNMKHEFLQIGISAPREKLYLNIKKRLEVRFRAGLINEVKKLRAQGLSWKKIQSFGLAYFWTPLYLQKKINKSDLFEKIYQAEKNYARRQMTWFRKDKRIKWLKNYQEIEKAVQNFIK